MVVDDQGNVAIGPMPSLGSVRFAGAKVNGANAGLVASEEIHAGRHQRHTIVTPSASNQGGNTFNDCTYASTCKAPT